MRSLVSLMYGSLATLLWVSSSFDLASAASIPRFQELETRTRADLNSNTVRRELGSRLSSGTLIFGPNDERFAGATARWNMFAPPQIQVVIQPGAESDVSKIVKYCNDNSIDFLALNRGHGNSRSLGSFNGVQISLVSLVNIAIQPSRQSAWFGGGVYGGLVTKYLWERGFVTTTGSCDCVGLLGAGLGGGHGRHEALYGMVSDNIRQLNIVLGDGRAINVSPTSNSDLLWAMKGAGHNFGIVTSFELNIFPRGPDTWHYHNYIWAGDQLEPVFNALNAFHNNGSTPVNMTTNFGSFFLNASVSTTDPILSWTFAYRGSAEKAEALLTQFNAIPAIYEEQGDVPYSQVSKAQATAEDDFICMDGNKRITTTAGLQVYNVTAERLIYEGFRSRAISNPALAAGCGILHEGYATAGVTSKNPADSAYPFRSDHHLMLFNGVVPPGDAVLEAQAWEWANEVRDMWNAGQPGRPANNYVNYANGFEDLDSIYGWESWRLQRLRALKQKYDPQNKFRFYNPIVEAREGKGKGKGKGKGRRRSFQG
ncbi:hypothetical protein QBC40DRAFT_259878 [Triangularia verruculosa]|uniref:FAD-binding PCMH-type domain-containing protein n=1 Tax=Triangularia verruculosa TaxID=2587418 RepID=A0AAN7APP7_9PEZI|nr:hypothetical protein QBC40DRAFT_259878 [Triangularia verruculosa]